MWTGRFTVTARGSIGLGLCFSGFGARAGAPAGLAGLKGPIPITNEGSSVPFTYWPAWTGFAMGAIGIAALAGGIIWAVYVMREQITLENGQIEYRDWRGKKTHCCRVADVLKVRPPGPYTEDSESCTTYEVTTKLGGFKFNQMIRDGRELHQTLVAAARQNGD